MQFQLTTLPASDPATVADELRRFITNVGAFGLQMVVVQPPYAKRPLQVWVLDVPDAVAPWVEDRLLPIVLGPTGTATRTGPVAPRAEWTHHALLLPTGSAQALDPLLLRSWTSAHLHCRWTPGRCGALLHYSSEDTGRLDEIRAVGWRVVPLTPLVTRVVRHPILTWPSPLLPRLTSAEPLAAQALVTVPAAATPQDLAAETSQLTQPRREPLPSALAGPGEPGLLLGVTPQDAGVRLAWRAMAVAIDAPLPRQRAAFLALLRRAFAQGMGVIAIVPRGLLSENALQPWADRLRVLDGERNPIESAAIPWQLLSPAALAEVLARLDITTPLPESLPSEFGALLHQLDAADLCTQAVLIATARPGDDLIGVAAQGGGVVLVDTDDPGSDLLGSLLVQLVAQRMTGDRPLVLVRPARLPMPPALAERCLQIVLGRSAAAVATLTAQPGHWVLTDAQGEIVLDADLTRTPSEIADGDHAALVRTLTGGDGPSALPALPAQSEPDVALGPAQTKDVPSGELAVIPALALPAWAAHPPVEPGLEEAPAHAVDQPLPPMVDDVVVLEDWSATLGDTIAEIDPEVTDPTAFVAPRMPLPAPAPVPAAEDTFNWWAVTDEVAATLGGTVAAPVAPPPILPASGVAAPADGADTELPTRPPVQDDPLPLPIAAALPDVPTVGDARALIGAPSDDALAVALRASTEPEVGTGALPELPALTLAPFGDDWDVQLGGDDRGAIVDAPLLHGDGRVAGDEAPRSEDDRLVESSPPQVTLETAGRPAAQLWLRPQRRRWTPGQVPQRASVVAVSAPPAQHPEANLVSLRSEPVVLDASPPEADLLAIQRGVPAQASGGVDEALDARAAQEMAPVDQSASAELPLMLPTAELLTPQSTLDEALPLSLVLVSDGVGAQDGATDQAAQDLVAESVTDDQPNLGALPDQAAFGVADTAQGHDDLHAAPLVPVTAVSAAPEPGASLGSTVPAVSAPDPAGDHLPLPDAVLPAVPPAARIWPDVDRAAIISAWRGGRSAPELVQQLQAVYPAVATGELRQVVRASIQAALDHPAAARPVPPIALFSPPAQEPQRPAPDHASVVDRVPGSATAFPVPVIPAQGQPVASATNGQSVVPSAQPDALPRSTPILPRDPTATDDHIWAAWLANRDLNEMIRALSGLTPRSVPGQAARDRIHQVVVPRIVAELGVEALVGRWVAHEPLRDDDREPFELLLQRMNRQSHPVTGPIRAKTEQRLRSVMQPVLAALAPVGEG